MLIDDCIIVNEYPQNILEKSEKKHNYRLMYVGKPSSTCHIPAQSHETFNQLKPLCSKRRVNTPAPTDFYPEYDTADFLHENSTALV